MKKIFYSLITICLFITSISFAQTTKRIKLDTNGDYMISQTENKSIKIAGKIIEYENPVGTWYAKDKNDKILSIHNFENGHKAYFNDGKKCLEKIEKEWHDLYTIYSKYGEVATVCKVNKGSIEPEYEYLKSFTETINYKNGSKEIKTIVYIIEFTEYENKLSYKHHRYNYTSINHGIYKKYNANNNLIIQGNFSNNLKEGKWEYFYSNGNKKSEGNYIVEDEYEYKDGNWTYYFDNGAIHKEVKFDEVNFENPKYIVVYDIEGNKILETGNGIDTEYYSNGNIKIEATLVNNRKNGKFKEYYENRQLLTEGDYIDGYKNSSWSEWLENGKLFSKGEYKNGKKMGLWKMAFYSENEFDFPNLNDDSINPIKDLELGEVFYKTGFFIENKNEADASEITYESGETLIIVKGKKITFYYRNGGPYCTGKFDSFGDAVGNWKFYDKKGKLYKNIKL